MNKPKLEIKLEKNDFSEFFANNSKPEFGYPPVSYSGRKYNFKE